MWWIFRPGQDFWCSQVRSALGYGSRCRGEQWCTHGRTNWHQRSQGLGGRQSTRSNACTDLMLSADLLHSIRACASGDGTKVTERIQNADFRAENRRFSQIHPWNPGNSSIWRAQETAENRRFSQETEDFRAENRRLGSVTLGASPLARPYSMCPTELGCQCCWACAKKPMNCIAKRCSLANASTPCRGQNPENRDKKVSGSNNCRLVSVLEKGDSLENFQNFWGGVGAWNGYDLAN